MFWPPAQRSTAVRSIFPGKNSHGNPELNPGQLKSLCISTGFQKLPDLVRRHSLGVIVILVGIKFYPGLSQKEIAAMNQVEIMVKYIHTSDWNELTMKQVFVCSAACFRYSSPWWILSFRTLYDFLSVRPKVTKRIHPEDAISFVKSWFPV